MLPNMTYIVSRQGRILFKSDWTDPPTVRAAMDYIAMSRGRRAEGQVLKPFYAEMVGMRWTSATAMQDGLRVAGPKAEREFAEAMARWQAGKPMKGRVVIDE